LGGVARACDADLGVVGGFGWKYYRSGFILEYERSRISPLDAPVKIMTISFVSLIVTTGVVVAIKLS
jgi:hypothetical protein